MAASRIITQRRNISRKQRQILYKAWKGGELYSNRISYLSFLNKRQVQELQTACNKGLLSIKCLPRYGQFPMTNISKS